MKRIKLLVAIALMPLLAMAQPGPVSKVLPVKIDLGIKVGGNFANLNGKEWESGYKPGIVGGIFGGVSRNRIGVSAEVLLSSVKYTGNKVNFYQFAKTNYVNIADSNKQGEFAVTYLNIPVLLNFKIGGPLWVQLGPQYSGVMSVKDNQNLLKDTKTLFKSGDLSGVIGLQLNLAKFRASARYIIGLSDLSYNTASDTWKTRTVQIALGYTFL